MVKKSGRARWQMTVKEAWFIDFSFFDIHKAKNEFIAFEFGCCDIFGKQITVETPNKGSLQFWEMSQMRDFWKSLFFPLLSE